MVVRSLKNTVLCFFCLFLFLGTNAGQTLVIEMDKDTISLEETIKVKYQIDDACDASELKFPDFLVVSGPNVSRSISIINGKRTRESSYTVILTPINEGTFTLPTSLCGTELVQPVQIVVRANYESKQTKDEKVRKKRKIKKIR